MYVLQGASEKSGICFMVRVFIKLNTNLLGIYFIGKVGSIDLTGEEKKIYDIREPRYKLIRIGYQIPKILNI